jgi:hypothetical protein
MSIRETIPAAEAGNIVLYIGTFNADIQIIGHESNEVKISGTKFAFGYRQEEVKRRLKQIEVKRKQVDSFYVTGWVESVSGKIHVMMDKAVADDIRLSAATRCGSISYGLWRTYPNFPHNSTPESIWLHSVSNGEAVALTLLTQSGDIVLETVS